MATSTADIIARLRLKADDFSAGLAREFGGVVAASRDASAQIEREFDKGFRNVQQIASKALAMPRNAGGSLDLGTAEARQAAQAAETHAQALREVATAAENVARKTNDTSESTRLYVQAARAAAVEGENNARAARQQAASLELIQAELNQTKSATELVVQGNRLLNASQDTVTRGARGMGSGMMMLGQQAQDFTIQVGSGTSALTAFGQQFGQATFAMQGMGGTLGKVGTFLAGGWGTALTLGITGLALFGDKLFGAAEEAENLIDKLRQQHNQTLATEAAQRAFANTLDGVEASLIKNADAIRSLNRAGKTAAQIALENAKAELQKSEAIRKTTLETIAATRAQIELNKARAKVAAMDPRVAGPVLADASAQERTLQELEAKLTRADRAIRASRSQISNASRLVDIEEREEDKREREKRERQSRSRSRTRTNQEALNDYVAELRKRGIGVASTTRTAAEQNALFQAKRTPLDGYKRMSRHQTAEAVDFNRATFNERAAYEAAAAAGLKNFEIITESGGRKHAEWRGHGKAGDASDIIADQERAAKASEQALKRTAELQDRLLVQAQEKLSVEAETVRFFGLRAAGLDKESAVEGEIADIRRESAKWLQEMAATYSDSKERKAFLAAESRVSDAFREQLSTVEQQGSALGQLLLQHGDIEARTEEQQAAILAQNDALATQLEGAKALAKTAEERKLLEESIAKLKGKLPADAQEGRQNAEDAKRNAELLQKANEEAWESWQDQQRDQIESLADFYEDAFNSGGKSIWESFKAQGKRALATMAAQWTMSLLNGQQSAMPSILQQMGATSGGGGGNPLGAILSLFGGGSGGGGGLGQIAGQLFGSGGAPGGLQPVASGWGSGATQATWSMGNILQGGMGEAGAIGGSIGGASGLSSMLGTVMQGVPQMAAAAALANGATSLISNRQPFLGGLFGVVGNLLFGKKPPKPSATAVVSAERVKTRSRDGGDKGAAGGAGNAVTEGLENIMEALGLTDPLGAFKVSIGQYKGKWRVSPSGRSDPLNFKGGSAKGLMDFGDDQQGAIEAAIRDAIKDGALTGLSAASKVLLSKSGDLEKQLEKAVLIETIPKRLKAMMDPVGAAIDELNAKWKKTVDALREGGATAEQMAEAQKLYGLEMEQVKASTGSASQSLKDFLDDLNFGGSSPYSLRDQEAQALAKLQPFLDKIASGEAVDSGAYQEAASRYLEIERELYGSTAQFFQEMDRIQAATGREIARIDNATPIRTISDPFAEATATNTAEGNAIARQQLALQTALNQSIGQLVNRLGGSFVGAGRGFAA